MKIGLLIDHAGLEYGAIKDLASKGDELGYYSISLRDNSRISKGSLDTWSLLPGIALNTRKARILPLVTDNVVRHPGILAKMTATVDIISKGRLVFGIGAGFIGPPGYATRLKMLDESLQVMLKLWTEEQLSSFKGEFYNLDNAESLPKPMQKPHPPILIGGSGEQILDLVAKYGNMSNFYLRGFNLSVCSVLLEKLKSRCEKEMRGYQSILKTATGKCVMESSGDLSASATLSGSPAQILEQLSEYRKIGIDLFIIRFPESQAENMKLFAERILAHVPA
ncbi:MAG: LLM class flavin-dependent oxidoreductase [Nitrososphaerales archaeon]